MAFLSSFRNARETIYPESLRERLRNFPLLADIGDAALKQLLTHASWFGLPGGALLPHDGENDRALFLVVAGCLGAFVDDEHGAKRLAAHIPAGEAVGEMSLISGQPHTAQLVALRDTELLRVGREAFESLIARHPRVMLNLMRILIRRLNETTRKPLDRAQPKTFAIVPLQPGLASEDIAQQLTAALGEMGSHAAVLDVRNADESADWFNRFEAAHDIVFYRGDAPETAWTSTASVRPIACSCWPIPIEKKGVPLMQMGRKVQPPLLPAGSRRRVAWRPPRPDRTGPSLRSCDCAPERVLMRLATRKRGKHHGSAQRRIEKEEHGPEGRGQAAFRIRYEIANQERFKEEARWTHDGAFRDCDVARSQDVRPAFDRGQENYRGDQEYTQPGCEGGIECG